MEFQAWPKTPRLYREMVITEKIDGTNAAVVVELDEAGEFRVGAQSRSRIITPDVDNHGFARWVYDNAAELAGTLGVGRHFGEWWGSGIQRGYGLPNGEKRFSLFNVGKWGELDTDLVSVVPVLWRGLFDTDAINATLGELVDNGSQAAPGYMNPEGICVFHVAAGRVFKVLAENDDLPKSVVA